MSLITSTRNQQATLINQNKASIIITRQTRTLANGAYTTADTVLASQDFRLYFKTTFGLSAGTRDLGITDGGWYSKKIVKMLAKYDANVKRKSATNKDIFTYGGRDYFISDVVNHYVGGSIVFKECVPEEIK